MFEPKEASSAVPACSASILHCEQPWEKQSVMPRMKTKIIVNSLYRIDQNFVYKITEHSNQFKIINFVI